MENIDRLLERVSEICRALGHAKRLQIVRLLGQGRMSAGDLSTACGTTPANVSQHMQILRQAGIVESRREASNVYYWLTSSKVTATCSMIEELLADQIRREQDLFERMDQ